MAGSLKFIKYISDDNSNWALLRDESNVEGVVVDDASVDIAQTDLFDFRYVVPRNMQPRFATFRSTTTSRIRKVTLPTQAIYNDLASGAGVLATRDFTDALTGENFTLQSLSPERLRPVVTDIDTGLTDSDAT